MLNSIWTCLNGLDMVTITVLVFFFKKSINLVAKLQDISFPNMTHGNKNGNPNEQL